MRIQYEQQMLTMITINKIIISKTMHEFYYLKNMYYLSNFQKMMNFLKMY